MSSTRLPGKVLMDIAGRPMLARVVERIRRAQTIDEVVVATSVGSEDDPIEKFCASIDVPCERGSRDDVLSRFHAAAIARGADVVVRLTADCPLLDPEVIDLVVKRFQQGDCDYATNVIRRTDPDGLDVEVFSFAALDRTMREAAKPSEREHVTPFMRHSGEFRVAGVERDRDWSRYRWTVDVLADLKLVSQIYETLGREGGFDSEDIVRLLEARPDMQTLNADQVTGEGYYRSLYLEAKTGHAPARELKESRAWLNRSLKVIPCGAQTFSKAYFQWVQGAAPIFLERGKGCRVWDVDGNEYIDYVQGLLPNILGYADDRVTNAVRGQLAHGHCFSLPNPMEVRLAERLTQMIPCAEMVRFGKNGSDVTSGAVRAARAFTERDRIACSGYHGWQDWFIGTTTRNQGVPKAVRELTHPFPYGDLASLEALFEKYPGEFAAVIMEPVNFTEPAPGYLRSVKELCLKNGTLLIYDEVCSGFHFGLGGAQKKYGVTPDLGCFGKAMGNGYPIAFVAGRRDVMEIFEDIFFSFTFAGDVSAMAAAMVVLDVLEKTDALARMESQGRILQDGFNALAKEAGLESRLRCVGTPRWSLLRFLDASGKDSALEKSLFQQEVVKRGVLVQSTHNMCAAHDTVSTEKTLEAYAAAIKTLKSWLSDKNPASHLDGHEIEPVFKVR